MIERLGFYEYRVDCSARLAVTRVALACSLTLYGERECGDTLSFRVAIWQNTSFERGLQAQGIAYKRSGEKGVAGTALSLVRRPSFLIGVSLALAVYILLSSLIWEVRVVSSEDVDEDEVLQYLSEAGLREGVWRRGLDADAIAAAYLLLDEDSAFVSIHIDGLIAYVERIPKEPAKLPNTQNAPAHIVAERDGIVEEIEVLEGAAVVKRGEVVKAGQLLVSGAITTKGGTRFVAAEARVMARVQDTITISVPYERERLIQGESKRVGFSLSLFGKSFSYGEQKGDYIARERIYLFGFIRLPIVISHIYQVACEQEIITMTEQQTAALAMVHMRSAVLDYVADGTLLKKEMVGEFTDNGYILTCTIVYERNIAKSLAFSVDN